MDIGTHSLGEVPQYSCLRLVSEYRQKVSTHKNTGGYTKLQTEPHPQPTVGVRHAQPLVVSVVRAPPQWRRAFPGGREESAANRTRETCRGTAEAWRLDWR